ncbi:MAG TPA: cytochrome c oxidase subunit II [Thermodesulfobacteriota bacterium]
MAHGTYARPGRVRFLSGVVLPALTILLSGCAGEYVQNAMDPHSDFAHTINDLFWTIIWWSIVIFILVEVLLIYAIFRFRRRPGQPLPAQVHGNTRIEIAWTLAPALILASVAVPTVQTIFDTQAPPAEENLQVRAIGHQWWWEFRYPQLDIVTANDLWLPRGRKVDIALESADVIHSFWAPKLGGKRDLVPGHVNHISLTPQVADLFWGQCAEFCGASHANMGFRVVVAEPAEFDRWVQDFKAPKPPDTTDPLAAKGAQAFITSACIGCHRIAGTPAAGVIGPDLTYFARRHTIAAGMMPNTPENLARWLRNPPAVKPGSKMPNLNLNDETVQALVAYLGSLK